MFAPLDLTLEELNVYQCLYKNVQFETFLTQYTLDQLVVDTDKRLDISRSKVNRILKKFIDRGYIKVYRKGSKGTATTYEIIEAKKWNLNGTQAESKRNLKVSACNGLNGASETQTESKRNSNDTPIKEKEKESKIYSRVVTRLNELASTKYKASTKKTQTLISARVKEGFNEDDFYKVIEVKTKEWLGTEMEKYLRPQTLFGTKFENYLNQKEKTPSAKGALKNKSYNQSICKDKENNSFESKFKGEWL